MILGQLKMGARQAKNAPLVSGWLEFAKKCCGGWGNRRGLVIGILFEPSTDGPLSAGPRVKWSIRRQLLLWQEPDFGKSPTSLFGWQEYLNLSISILLNLILLQHKSE